MKNIIYIIIILIVIGVVIFFSYRNNKNNSNNKFATSQNASSNLSNNMKNLKFPGILSDNKIKNKKAIITTSKGVIEFELYADRAPKTVSNFVYLSEIGFYNGLTFHRVEPGFVIQGGDPSGNGTGGPGYSFEDEKVVGDYKKGTVAMANSGDNTNGSQFFICLEDQPSLPKKYNLFGQVTSGIEVVSKIQVGDKIEKIQIVNK